MAKRSEKNYQFWSSQLLTVFIFHLVSDYGKGSFFIKVVVLPSTSLPFITASNLLHGSKKLDTTICPSIGDRL